MMATYSSGMPRPSWAQPATGGMFGRGVSGAAPAAQSGFGGDIQQWLAANPNWGGINPGTSGAAPAQTSGYQPYDPSSGQDFTRWLIERRATRPTSPMLQPNTQSNPALTGLLGAQPGATGEPPMWSGPYMMDPNDPMAQFARARAASGQNLLTNNPHPSTYNGPLATSMPSYDPLNQSGSATQSPAAGGQSAFQQNLAYLQSVNPELAMSYGLSPFHSQEFKQGIDAAQHGGAAFNPQGNSWGDSRGNALINAFNEPSVGYNAQNAALGLPSGWAPQVSPQWLGQYFDPTGKTITVGGKTYNLPVADAAFAQPTAQQRSGSMGNNTSGLLDTFAAFRGR